ncbi:3-methyl-2-oxobutanoate hydroxymethyltransferase [Chenggangzhangella methanolivorans]|uniref:3-methyl-2-oxobutanoate hydroxymethyltransferase n=1 Tax=Chenggangzhangella methanolivorans TaxID=1437009 RepID=A0A9E6UKI4_9HYPH|nr:3-methyl-2-oxobutanoate hydroxymethyltransferase [Chenggangzhangella methanolivorans]QZN99356.1 3-methyl-2-oxobutanoate hydroxymethyltransferase [Chenggangzhangella methanolivorans]
MARFGLVVGHLPFGSYHASPAQAVESAVRFVREGGANVVKCEGDRRIAPHVAAIVAAGVPVMGHVGMQASRRVEQSGFGIKGRSAEEAAAILDGARAFEEAGCFAFIAEQIPTELAARLTAELSAPVVTLGGGRVNDGVYHISGDLVGYSAFPIPKPRRLRQCRRDHRGRADAYRDDCVAGAYPAAESDVHMPPEELARFERLAGEKKSRERAERPCNLIAPTPAQNTY